MGQRMLVQHNRLFASVRLFMGQFDLSSYNIINLMAGYFDAMLCDKISQYIGIFHEIRIFRQAN
jgi:hypothetical protein